MADAIYDPATNTLYQLPLRTHSDGSKWVVLTESLGLALPVRATTEDEQRYLNRFHPAGVPWILAGHNWWQPPKKRSRHRDPVK